MNSSATTAAATRAAARPGERRGSSRTAAATPTAYAATNALVVNGADGFVPEPTPTVAARASPDKAITTARLRRGACPAMLPGRAARAEHVWRRRLVFFAAAAPHPLGDVGADAGGRLGVDDCDDRGRRVGVEQLLRLDRLAPRHVDPDHRRHRTGRRRRPCGRRTRR